MKGSLKGSCCPPSITAAEPARVMAPEGPLEANHRPFRAEPPAGAEPRPGATLQILLSATNTQNKLLFLCVRFEQLPFRTCLLDGTLTLTLTTKTKTLSEFKRIKMETRPRLYTLCERKIRGKTLNFLNQVCFNVNGTATVLVSLRNRSIIINHLK